MASYIELLADYGKLESQKDNLLSALKIAEQFMSIASDWNFDECEIDGEMRSTYELLEKVREVISMHEVQS